MKWVSLPLSYREDIKWASQGHTANKWLNLDLTFDLCDLKALPWDEGPSFLGTGMEALRAPEGNRRQLHCPHLSGTFL